MRSLAAWVDYVEGWLEAREYERVEVALRRRSKVDRRLFETLRGVHRGIRRRAEREIARGRLGGHEADSVVAALWERGIDVLTFGRQGSVVEADLRRWHLTISEIDVANEQARKRQTDASASATRE